MSDNYLVLDKEITNTEYGHARNKVNRHLLSVWYYQGKYYYNRGTEYDLAVLHEAIEQADFIVAQNAKYELQWLQREGFDIANVLVYDTMLGEYVIQGNLRAPLDLDSLARKYGVGTKSGYISNSIKRGICPSELPFKWLLDYCWNDVLVTKDVFLKQREILNSSGLLPTMFTRCILTPVIADVEFNGMHLDSARVNEEYTKLINEVADLAVELRVITGGINLDSTKQLATYLYDTLKFTRVKDYRGKEVVTKGGKPPTDTDTILKLKAKTKEQKKFIEAYVQYNKKSSALSKNIEYFYGVCKEHDGVFYANLNQTITKTHRLSSNGNKLKFSMFDKPKSVQFQNLPGAYKRLFSARLPGWKIGERDEAQLEYRGAGFLSGEPVIYKEVEEKYDVHSFTASILNDVDYDWLVANKNIDDTAYALRKDAKFSTFKPTYGGKSGTDKEMKYYEAFRLKYSTLSGVQENWVATVLNTKKLKTITGLVFYWPDTKMTSKGYITNTPQIYNCPIQSFCSAEIVPIVLVYMWHFIRALELLAYIVNTVHDSIITEEPENETKVLDELSKWINEYVVALYLDKVYGIYFDMPLEIESKVSDFWG